MNIPTLMAIREAQDHALAFVAPQANNLLNGFDTMEVEEFYNALLDFAKELSAMASTLTTEILVGSEAMAEVIAEMQEFDAIARGISE